MSSPKCFYLFRSCSLRKNSSKKGIDLGIIKINSNNILKKYIHKNSTLLKLLSSYKKNAKTFAKPLSPQVISKTGFRKKDYFAKYNEAESPGNETYKTMTSLLLCNKKWDTRLRLVNRAKEFLGNKIQRNEEVHSARLIHHKGKMRSDEVISSKLKVNNVEKEKVLKVGKRLTQRDEVYSY